MNYVRKIRKFSNFEFYALHCIIRHNVNDALLRTTVKKFINFLSQINLLPFHCNLDFSVRTQSNSLYFLLRQKSMTFVVSSSNSSSTMINKWL